MSPTIYRSPFPDVPLNPENIFTHLFQSVSSSRFASPSLHNVGGFPPNAPAFIDAASGTTITRAHLKHLALSCANGLLHHPGLRPPRNNTPSSPLTRGDAIMVFSPNSLAFPVVLLGAIAAGLRATLANSAYTVRELAHQWIDSRARVVCVSEDLVPVVREMFAEIGVSPREADARTVVLGNDLEWIRATTTRTTTTTTTTRAGYASGGCIRLENLLSLGALAQEEKFEGADVDQTVLLCYSSGTTGKPKGVETTHKNLTSVLDMVVDVFPRLEPGKDVFLGFLPFFHIYGAVKVLLFPFHNGIPVVVMSRFEPDAFCATVQRYKVTASLVVPPVLVVLARHPAASKYDMSTLKLCLCAAAPLGSALVEQVSKRLLSLRKNKDKQSLIITQGYGLTETSPTTHILTAEHAQRKVGSIGLLLPNMQARLVADLEGHVDAAQGESGELWVRGPNIMKGYLNNEAATLDSITPDGWFKTGDMAVRDHEGFYWIVDRRKELIKYKGFQVPPAELESVLLTHPEIADAAVIGIDSPAEATELPRAYVVHAEPTKLKSERDKVAFGRSVEKWISSRVAKHKLLRGGVVVIDAVPKSGTGKILRRELRERAKQELALEGAGQDVKAKL